MSKNNLSPILGKFADTAFWRNSGWALLMQVVAILLTLGTSLAIARLGGDQEFGVYTLVFTWVMTLGVFAAAGSDDWLVKHIPAFVSANHPISSLIYYCTQRVWVFSAATVAIFLLALYIIPIHGLSEYKHFFSLAMIAVPLYGLMHLYSAALRGTQRIKESQIPEKIVKPLTFLVVILAWYGLGKTLDDIALILFNALSFAMGAMVAYGLFLRIRLGKGSTPVPLPKDRGLANKFLFITLLQVLATRIDILLLGFYMGDKPEQIAYYNVALKYSEFLLMPLVIVNTVTGPTLSKLHAEGRKSEMTRLFVQTNYVQAALTVLGGLFLAGLGPWLMAIFGKSFGHGYWVLVIFCVGQVVYSLFGPIGYLMMMSDNEYKLMTAQLFGLLLAVILHVILIPMHGIYGAAIATSIGNVLYQMVITYFAWRKGYLGN